jgi:hypothetical protein
MQTEALLRRMAVVVLVDVDAVPLYTQYFDVTIIPSTLFFYNAQHIKIDWGFVLFPSLVINHYSFLME